MDVLGVVYTHQILPQLCVGPGGAHGGGFVVHSGTQTLILGKTQTLDSVIKE